MSCLFCKIVEGSIPSTAVYQDELCYAFADLHPQAPVHVLVAPREHIGSLEETDQDSRALLGHLLWAAARIARDKGLAKGYRVVVNTGQETVGPRAWIRCSTVHSGSAAALWPGRQVRSGAHGPDSRRPVFVAGVRARIPSVRFPSPGAKAN
jgi:histidine triad (HIT) family protein